MECVEMPNYSTDLQGFVCRDGGISRDEWLEWAAGCKELQRCEPTPIRNPFKPGEFVSVRSANFLLMAGGDIAGLLVWEDAKSVGVAGKDPRLTAFVSRLCAAFRGQFLGVKKSFD
jgi:hypothetical protein